MQMTSRERLRAALDHRPPDRAPLDLGGTYATGINLQAYRCLKDHLGINTPSRLASQRSGIAWVEDSVRARLGIDTYPLLPGVPDGSVLQLDVDTYRDEWGVVRKRPSPIMSPTMFRSLIKPRQKRFLESVKGKTEAKVLYHTCGAIYPLISDFIEAGVDVLNPVQTTATGIDPLLLKREFGRDLAFWGAVDTQHLLPKATSKQVEKAVRGLVDILGSDGGYVVGAANNIQADTPPANIVAMANAIRPATHLE